MDLSKINFEGKKVIITSGCSYTNQHIQTIPTCCKGHKNNWYWPDWLQYYKGDDYILLNLGNETNDNSSIVNIILYTISELKKLNVTEIELAIQWTNPFRMSFYIETPTPINGPHTVKFIDKDNKGFWYLTGGFRDFNILNQYVPVKFLEQYLPFYNNKVNCYNRFFKEVLLLQSYCLTNNIKWISFFMNDSITENYYNSNKIYSVDNQKISIGEDLILQNNLITNIDSKLIWEENTNIEYLSKLINFNNFYFFNTNDYKYGGLYEYCIKNYNRDILSSYIEDDLQYAMFKETMGQTQYSIEEEIQQVNKNKHKHGHPSPIMARYFVDNVLKNLVFS
jgi:hypothetical protein